MRLKQFRYSLFLQSFCVCLVCGQGQESVGSSTGTGLESSTSSRTGSESDGYSGSASPSTIGVDNSSTRPSSYDINSNTNQSTSGTPSTYNGTLTLSTNFEYTTTQSTSSNTTTSVTSKGHNENLTSSMSTTTANSTTTETTTISTTTTGTTETPCLCPDFLNISKLFVFKTSVNLNVSLVYLSNGTICPDIITITCEAQTLFPWTILFGNNTLELSNGSSTGEVEIKDLSEYTNYTCIANDSFNLTSEVSFRTLEEVPSEPLELSTSPLNATSFVLTWKEPSKVPSILEGYRVNITRLEEASEGHFCCNCTDIDIIETRLTKNTTIFFYEALADFVYQITVEALSNVGYGNASIGKVITPISASEPPTNVSITLNEEEREKNVLFTLNISWNMPCNTNGPANQFNVYLLGLYKLNDSVTDSRMETLEILTNQTGYLYSFSNLFAASKYTVSLYATTGNITGVEYDESFKTNTNFPSALEIDTLEVNAEDFTLTWMEPSNNPGNIENYTLNIEGHVNYKRTLYCHNNTATYNITTQVTEFSDKAIPYGNYLIYLSAHTSRGQGNMTNVTFTTNMTYPDSFSLDYKYNFDNTTELYDDNVTLRFTPGCFNGKFEEIVVNFTGKRINFDTHQNTIPNLPYDTETYTFDLKPEYSYDVTVTVKNEQFSTMRSTSFISQAGVPVVNSNISKTIQIVPQETKTTLVLKKKDFDSSNGQVKFLAIIVSDKNVTGGEFGKWWDNSQWPAPQGKNGNVYYQATPTFWEPFKSSDIKNFTLGEGEDCTDNMDYCNGPLQPGTQYYVLIRIFNDYYYRNTMPIPFKTLKTKWLGLILGVIFGLLAASCAAFAVFIMWRKGLIKFNSRDNSIPGFHTEMPKKKFIEHCKYLEVNAEALRAEWNELEEKSKPIYEELSCEFAILPANQRKNRYTNILPFDHSRVKLNIDEDDEICSDYINASYIKGFFNENAYIATQGPLSGTCRDFWKMILQEDISIIVMVSKFIENNRDKCYKYFPNNRETMTLIGDDIEVRCSMELNFGFYCIRTLQVKKALRQVTVTHLQYLEWPDFGVPSGTDSMLQFCHQFKERWAAVGGMAIIHCSAGVGRTGTLIATDILLRNVAAGRKLDVFNTVLELRRQRKSMVQTEIQYMYIYQLIRSMLECPILDEDDIQTEPLYANVDLDNKSRKGIVETAL